MDVVKGKVSKKVTKFSDFAYFCLSGEWELFFEKQTLQTGMLFKVTCWASKGTCCKQA